MADFRRWIPALALLVLVLGVVAPAGAQITPFTCSSSAVPPLIRGEGLTELVGDVVIDCTGGDPAASSGNANFTVLINNTTITSRSSEPLLVYNAPTDSDCESEDGCGTVFVGNIETPHQVTFLGVPITPPGSNVHHIYRMTNIRVNAATLFNSAGIPGQVSSSISISVSTVAPVLTGNVNLVVGFVTQGLVTGVGGLGSFPQCLDKTNASIATITFKENFATAFKAANASSIFNPDGSSLEDTTNPQDRPGANHNTESGLAYNDASSAGGTEFKAVFSAIPSGVTVAVANYMYDGATCAVLVGSGTTSCSGDVAAVNVTGQAVWQVVSQTSLAASIVDTLTSGVWVSFTANPSTTPGLAPAGAGMTVLPSFYPTAPEDVAAPGTPNTVGAPIFVIQAVNTPEESLPHEILNINTCRTILLFPFVTSKSGFDTGMAIANTSKDPFGTTNQTGTCTLNLYGEDVPADPVDSTNHGTGVTDTDLDASGNVLPGGTWTVLASADLANFQGYVIASCNFQYAHGFAFVSDLGARNLAMGYLPMIIPDPNATSTGTRRPDPFGGANTGEQLGF